MAHGTFIVNSTRLSEITLHLPYSLFSPLVPLMMGYVTRYMFGTDKLRTNAFEVRGLNGSSSGIIHCDDLAILSQWLKFIADNIVGLTQLQVSLLLFDGFKCKNSQQNFIS